MIFKIILFLVLGFNLHCYVDADEDCGDLDLTIRQWSYILTDDGLDIHWSLGNETDCLLEYHVTVTDEELGVIEDAYVEEGSTHLDHMSPCILYTIGVTVINKVVEVEGPYQALHLKYPPRPQLAPILQSLDIHSTYFNMTWALEGDVNRCSVKALYINGGTSFNITVPLEDLQNPATVPVGIGSLMPNTLYYFQVYVENSAGLSSVTQAGVQTTKTL